MERLIIIVASLIYFVQGEGWNYFGANDQWSWGKSAAVCDSGKRQSPIDIRGMQTVYNGELTEPKFTWNKTDDDHILVDNDGLKVGTAMKGDLFVEGAGLPGKYKVYGCHWHWGRQDYKGSEHLYSGRAYPLEVHVVTYSERYRDVGEAVTSGDSNALAVFGTMYQITEDEDPILNKFIDVFDQIKMPSKNKVRLDAFNLADVSSPDRTKYFRYLGSLTTPGCQEKVIWTNFVIPRKITKEQMAKFRTLSALKNKVFPLGDNYREPQPMNDRKVQRSFQDIRPVPVACDIDTVAYDTDSAVSHTVSIMSLLVAILMAMLVHP